MEKWFTSDTHWGHNNIVDFCKRPYASVEEMNEALIDNWNACVKPKDEIYHLGDVCFTGSIAFLGRLNGRIHFIRGNHDKRFVKLLERVKPTNVEWIRHYHEIRDGGQLAAVLFHYPLGAWNCRHYGSMCLHGHSHGGYPFSYPRSRENGKIIDVGVDCWNYRPVSWAELKELGSSL